MSCSVQWQKLCRGEVSLRAEPGRMLRLADFAGALGGTHSNAGNKQLTSRGREQRRAYADPAKTRLA
jgi:hypothetical protein